MGTKYIRNTDDATIVCKLTSVKNKSFIFYSKKIDKSTGSVISNGYTAVSDEDLAMLRNESNVFQYYEKKGKLVAGDNLPAEAMTQEQLIAALRSEIAFLKRSQKEQLNSSASDDSAKVAELQSALEEAQTALEEAQTALQGANEKIEEHEKMIEVLEEQIAAMAAEMAEPTQESE